MKPVHSAAKRSGGGFTLLELLVSIAVAAVLLGIAVPSYLSIVQRNTIAANVNDLVGALNYARSEAVARGRSVYLCPSLDQERCTTQKNWNQGWIVFAPEAGENSPTPDNRLRVQSELAQTIDIRYSRPAGTPLEFDANGFALKSDGVFVVRAANENIETRIRIATSGRIERVDPGRSS